MEDGILILFLLLALGSFVVSLLQFLQIGPPLNNAYIYTPKADRDKLNLKPIYIQTGTVFTLLAFEFLFLAGTVYYPGKISRSVSLVFTTVIAVYAIGSDIYMGRKKQ